MYRRNIKDYLQAVLADTPVVLLHGARQTGKTTLVENLAGGLGGRYLTLDDATVLAAVTADPAGFVRQQDGMIIIDEVQKAPDLFPAIKQQVDADRRPGRFLLTGSANILMLPRISESLAGRMEIVTLWPLSQGELAGQRERFIDAVFSSGLPQPAKAGPVDRDIARRVLTGGYPEAVERSASERRQAWFGAYITTILQRDVRDLAHVEGLTDMPRLLSLLAARCGGLLNMSELSRSSGIAHTSLRRYLSLLETTFLAQLLPAWSTNRSKRLVKSPKIHLIDSGLTSRLAGASGQDHPEDLQLFGRLVETFVVMELRKQATWNKTLCALYYFRTASGQEVDAVMEDGRGRVVGIEVKSAASVAEKDFAGLKVLADLAGKKFHRGIVLYDGDAAVPFGDRYAALPISTLWRVTE